MKRLYLTLAVASIAFLGVGCVQGRAPITGPLYSDISDGLIANPGPLPASPKVGTSTAKSIVGIATGDASIDAAVKSVGITKIHYVDYHTWSILGVIGETTTKVYGE